MREIRELSRNDILNRSHAESRAVNLNRLHSLERPRVQRIVACDVAVSYESSLDVDDVEVPVLRAGRFGLEGFARWGVVVFFRPQGQEAVGVVGPHRKHQIDIASESGLAVDDRGHPPGDEVSDPRRGQRPDEDRQQARLDHQT